MTTLTTTLIRASAARLILTVRSGLRGIWLVFLGARGVMYAIE